MTTGEHPFGAANLLRVGQVRLELLPFFDSIAELLASQIVRELQELDSKCANIGIVPVAARPNNDGVDTK